MSSHHITIAKASFTATCLRPDPTPLTREHVTKFHDRLESLILKCSPANVQTCREWLVHNVLHSLSRTSALGKLLVSYSKHTSVEDAQGAQNDRQPSLARRRLHILYLINDLVHHSRYHNSISSAESSVREGLQTQLSDLFSLVRSENRKNINRRLEDLLRVWQQDELFDAQILANLHEGTTYPEHSTDVSIAEPGALPPGREIPYVMPATHGDPTTPYYNLPAANLMPHIVPNRGLSMRPDQIRALQLSGGPADETLVNALKDFLRDASRLENPYHSLDEKDIHVELDDIGQLSYRNEADEVTGDTYYGWSKEFCERMKKRVSGDRTNGRGRRSRSYSDSTSRSHSRSPHKRQRYSQSPGRNRHDYRSRSRSRSPADRPTSFQQTKTLPISMQASSTVHTSNARYVPHPSSTPSLDGLPVPPPPPPDYRGPWPPAPPPLRPPGHVGMPFPVPPQFAPGSGGLPPPSHLNDNR